MTDLPPPTAGAPAEPMGLPVNRRDRPLPLRQMGIGELIDAAFRLYRLEWAVLLGIVAFVVIPTTFAQIWVSELILDQALTVPTSALIGQLVTVTIIFVLLQLLFVQPFLVAAIARAAADVYLGEPVTLPGTYRYALGRLFSILWITIQSLVVTLIGFLLLVIPGLILFVRLSFAPAALVVEGHRGRSALVRSWQLSAGHAWRIFGLLFVTGLISGVVGGVLTVPGEFAAQSMGPDGWIISALASALATVVTTPFSMLVIVLMYFDLRIRKEGFDIEVMARELATAQ
jgi:hypothetical protein